MLDAVLDDTEEGQSWSHTKPPTVKEASQRLERFLDSYKLTAADRVEVGQVTAASAANGFAGALAGATATYAWRYSKGRPLTKPLMPFMMVSFAGWAVGGALGTVSGMRQFLQTSQSPLAREYLRYLAACKANDRPVAYMFRDLPLPTTFDDDVAPEKTDHDDDTEVDADKTASQRRGSRRDAIRQQAAVPGLGRAIPGKLPELVFAQEQRKEQEEQEKEQEHEQEDQQEATDEPPQPPSRNPTIRAPRRNKYGDVVE